MEPLTPAEYQQKVEGAIEGALDNAKALAETNPSRELSLALTKLEEAQMWFDRVS